VTSAGAIREYPIPTPNAGPDKIVAGPDGNLWFTEQWGDAIGRLQPH
jgi:streptogramin lyase